MDLLQRRFIHFEESFESGCDACRLNLSPQSTLVASNAVHDAGNIAEVFLEFLFEQLHKFKEVMSDIQC